MDMSMDSDRDRDTDSDMDANANAHTDMDMATDIHADIDYREVIRTLQEEMVLFGYLHTKTHCVYASSLKRQGHA